VTAEQRITVGYAEIRQVLSRIRQDRRRARTGRAAPISPKPLLLSPLDDYRVEGRSGISRAKN
jgi:hypothetical protein